MGDLVSIRPKGSAIETLHHAAEECIARPELQAIVLLFDGTDPEDQCALYSEGVDPASAYYVLSSVALVQILGGSDDN
jgi:hypothetical protein